MKRLIFLFTIALLVGAIAEAKQEKMIIIPFPEDSEIDTPLNGGFISAIKIMDITYVREGNLLLRKMVVIDTVMNVKFQKGIHRSDFTGPDIEEMRKGGVIKKTESNNLSSVWPMLKLRPWGFSYKMNDRGEIYVSNEGFIGPEEGMGTFMFIIAVIIPLVILIIVSAMSTVKGYIYFLVLNSAGVAVSILLGSVIGIVLVSVLVGIIVSGGISGYAAYAFKDKLKDSKGAAFVIGLIVGIIEGMIAGGFSGVAVTEMVWLYISFCAGLCVLAFIIFRIIDPLFPKTSETSA